MKKRILYLLPMLAMSGMLFLSSCGGDDDDGGTPEVEVSPVKTIGVDYGDGVEGYTFTYDNQGRIDFITNTWEGEEVDIIDFDYSVAGKLTITKEDWPTVYEIDSEGRITKEFWNEDQTEWAAYQYNTEGFLIKVIEHWDGTDHNKFTLDVANGNVTRHTRYNDEGVINRIKDFTFFTSGSDNVNDLQQTNAVDSNWKVVNGLFGKSSKKLVNFLEYWNGAGDEANKKRTEITYTFDSKDRVATMIRAGDGFQESYSYTYYEE